MASTEVSSEVSPAWPAFPARLMALPAVNDACGLAAHLYQRSKVSVPRLCIFYLRVLLKMTKV